MDDRVNYNVDDDASNASFEVERGVPILNLNMSHVTEEDPDVEEVYNEDNHATRSPSVEVVNEKLSKLEDPEVNDNISNDNLSVEDSVHDDDGPGGPNVATSSMSKRKKCALALITSVALLALIIGLSVGLGGKNNDAQERSASSANSALTLEDCLAEAAAAGSVPTSMPTDNSDFPTESSEEEPARVSNDFDIDLDLVVRRDLRGNMKRRSTVIKAKDLSSELKSRRLQCDELIANQTP
mmetsp:Transcript_31278/g.65401  ORF Transcript_31278/g.65401 Transcript_31278/m.65401 type:complete len:240 (-) Transcript_31278:355-1074(-)